MTVLRCNDPRCRGNSCVVATVERGELVIISRHRGEKHTARLDIGALARSLDPSGVVHSA